MKNPHRHALHALASACLFISCPPASAGAPALHGLTNPPAAVYPDPADIPPPPVLEPNQLKLGSSLLALVNPTALLPGQTVAVIKAGMADLDQIILEVDANDGTPYGPVNSDLLRVIVRFNGISAPDSPGSIAGGHFFSWEEQADWSLLFGWLETDHLAAVAAIPQVFSIQALDPPRHRTAGGEGDSLINGPSARSSYNVNGSDPLLGQNVKVGIISNGVTNLGTAITSGDLPTVVNTPLGAGSGDEGTAMLEIVHEIAPGADLYFAPGGTTMQTHLTAAATLANAGCHIIADDIGWYQEPYFEPGYLGPSLANLLVTRPKLMFLSAAGNDAETHQQGGYIDNAAPSGYHDFPLWVSMPTGSSVEVFLQWNEPQNQNSTGKYDIHIIDNNSGTLVAWSTSSAFPSRTVRHINYGSPTIVHIDVQAVVNTGAILEIFMDPKNGATHYITNTTPTDAIFGHPGHPLIRAVAAVDYRLPATIEFFSSQGPWTQLTTVVGPKPDYTGPDFGTFSGAGNSHIPPYIANMPGFIGTPPPYYFSGTSAAAPHVAGVAALIWSTNLNLPTLAVQTALGAGATDRGVPGMDNVFGHGVVDALQSLIYQLGPLPPTTVTASDGTIGDRVAITWNSGIGADAYNVYASAISDPNTAQLLTLTPITTTGYADFAQPIGFAVRDQTMYYWLKSFNMRFARTGGWSAMESGFLQPSNLPPGLTVPSTTYQATTRLPLAFGGISVSDPDAGTLPVAVSLSATMGKLTVNTAVPGGVLPGQVTNNGTGMVSMGGTMTVLNTTLGQSNAIQYESWPAMSGSETVTCVINDLGNTGWGGQLLASKPVNLTVHLTRLIAWQHIQFPDVVSDPTKEATIWGRNANPDADLYSNTWELFMNTDPKSTTPPGQIYTQLTGGNFHIYVRVGAGINPASWTLLGNTTLDSQGWAPAGPATLSQPHPDAPADAKLWDLWVPYAPPSAFFRILFDPDFIEP